MDFPSYKFRRAKMTSSEPICVGKAREKMQAFVKRHRANQDHVMPLKRILEAMDTDKWMHVPGEGIRIYDH